MSMRLTLSIYALLSISCLFASGCLSTSIGMEHPRLRQATDFGPPLDVNVCVYLDSGITPIDAMSLLASWNDEANNYGLFIRPMSFHTLPREGFFHTGIEDQVAKFPLVQPCDRVLYFVNRNIGDLMWGDILPLMIPVPEVLGEVDDPTLTHGFVVAKRRSFNQIFLSPYAVTRHELYHLLGCKQHFDMPACYREIQALKRHEQTLIREHYFSRIGEQPFYPTWRDLGDTTLDSRAETNRVLAAEVAARSGSGR